MSENEKYSEETIEKLKYHYKEIISLLGEDVEREAIGTMSSYLDMDKLTVAPQLNGARKRAKFAGIALPDFATQTLKSSS